MVNDSIWIIDDDKDDHDLVREIVRELQIPNEVVFFNDARAVLQQLEDEKFAPFIMICDVNLPGMDGFELREKLLATPNKKHHSVPFIYWTNAAVEKQIDRAFKLYAHGFFIKEARFEDWKKTFIQILEYWRNSKMPSKKDNQDIALK